MKVLLINPPNFKHIGSVLPDEVENERGFNPPLGLLYLAGYLQRESPQVEIMIIDSLAEALNYDQIKKKIEDFSPDILGVTVMSFTLLDSLEIAKATKQINPNIKVVFGGPHVNIYSRETLDLGMIDFIVLGEGERIFNTLVNNIDNEEVLKQTRGLVFYDQNKEFIHTGLPDLIDNLDELALPARNLIDNNLYSSVLGTSKLVTTVMTSRGCPYKCSFCDRPHLGKVFRARSADDVLKEIKDCMKYGIREFLMYDDTFTIDRQRVIDVCNKIINEKLKIRWDVRARVNTIDEELLKKLKEAGCVRIHYGVESGTQKILDVLRKGITLRQVEDAFRLTRKVGIEILAYFMIGNPGETNSDIEETIRFAKSLKPDYVHITATVPFPATDLYKMALEQRIIASDVWLEFAKSPTQDFCPPLWEEKVKAQELQDYIKKAYHQFYFRPGYLIKRLFALKSFEELKIKVKAALGILKI
jgi:anaerobic magnesium-protoporphyrin IX monomethyl ester cyclase